MSEPEATIEAVLQTHSSSLLAVDGVVGLAEGILEDKPCIVVLVTKSSSELERKIPDKLDGYRLVTKVTGEFRASPVETREN